MASKKHSMTYREGPPSDVSQSLHSSSLSQIPPSQDQKL
ncbi:hypothetical protein CCACVL1_29677 [Corchorus capsularis]|uniref:Uncharacterized protein n=1 Tax=Corchorus capsularis TaxID=210143 RepID=A0A1R3G0L9_COCAP|nr:hypothetical protein CCACVL1_29677 [Corchorus capsularis]